MAPDLGVMGGWKDVLPSCPECEAEDLLGLETELVAGGGGNRESDVSVEGSRSVVSERSDRGGAGGLEGNRSLGDGGNHRRADAEGLWGPGRMQDQSTQSIRLDDYDTEEEEEEGDSSSDDDEETHSEESQTEESQSEESHSSSLDGSSTDGSSSGSSSEFENLSPSQRRSHRDH